MEFEYSDTNSKRSKLYIGVGLLMALLVAGIVFVALRGTGLGGPAQVTMRQVVVAAREIPSRKPIEDGDLAMRSVPVDPTNETAFTRIDEVLGRVSAVTITTGQLVTRSMLASASSGQVFSILEPGAKFDPNGPDLRAVSVSVPDERAVAGTLVPGQRVDLIVTVAINPELGQTPAPASSVAPAASGAQQVLPGPSTKVTLQMLTILARNGAIYILRADLGTSEKISELAAAGGQFTMVLRPDEDARTAKTVGSTFDALLKEFGFPVPRQPVFPSPSP
ncbi:MAG: Flp pilus assembly protein CpaB [Chloroflexota bacterium]